MEIKCIFWSVCGAAIARDYYAKQVFGSDDVRRNYIDIVCCVEEEFPKCAHYKLRSSLKKEEEK